MKVTFVDTKINSTKRIYFLDTTSYIYATSAGNVTLAAATLLTLGVAGTTDLGDGTLRIFRPNTDNKIDLGDASHRFNDAWLANITITDAKNIILGTTTGTKIGTATTQKLGFFNATPVIRQTQGATLTNNVTSGGTANQLDDFTSLTVYATDAATIRNDIYQLGQTLKTVVDALRTYGLLS